MQRDGSFQMRELFAESTSQTSESAKLHPHGEVVPLHETRRNMLRIGVTKTNLGYDLRDTWWGARISPEAGLVSAQQ
jgi:hypothetical protein